MSEVALDDSPQPRSQPNIGQLPPTDTYILPLTKRDLQSTYEVWISNQLHVRRISPEVPRKGSNLSFFLPDSLSCDVQASSDFGL